MAAAPQARRTPSGRATSRRAERFEQGHRGLARERESAKLGQADIGFRASALRAATK